MNNTPDLWKTERTCVVWHGKMFQCVELRQHASFLIILVVKLIFKSIPLVSMCGAKTACIFFDHFSCKINLSTSITFAFRLSKKTLISFNISN